MSGARAKRRACLLVLLLAAAFSLLAPLPGPLAAQSQGRRDVGVSPDEPVTALPEAERRFALVIGVDEYQHRSRISNLGGAVNDAKAIAEALKQNAGFPADQVFLLTSDAKDIEYLPNMNNIRRWLVHLTELVTARGRNGLLFVYFAGHGKAPDNEPYLLPFDVIVPNYSGTAISAAEIQGIIRKKQIEQVILVIDACRRDPHAPDRSGDDTQLTPAFRRFSFDAANRDIKAFATFYATGMNEYAYEFEVAGKKRGYFSYQLEKGLKGAAANERGEVTLAGLIKYLKEAVPTQVVLGGPDRRQNPHLDDVSGFKAEQLIVARIPPPSAALAPAPTPKPPAAAASLALPPAPPASRLLSYEFETIRLDAEGRETERRRGRARYYAEDLRAGVQLEMVEVPGGSFLMGEPRPFGQNSPQRRVTVSPFYMSRTEVTRGMWHAVTKLPKVNIDLRAVESADNADMSNLPVEGISWEEAVEFCARLSKKTGRPYRLPTEAEWEYAARAGTTTPYHFGEAINERIVNHKGSPPPLGQIGPAANVETKAKPVEFSGLSNDFGLYDMHGNVSEWCLDSWHDSYNGAPLDGSAWERGGNMSERVVRGGGYRSSRYSCRSSYRRKLDKKTGYYSVGFRIVSSGRLPPVGGDTIPTVVTTPKPAAAKPAPAPTPAATPAPYVPKRSPTPAPAARLPMPVPTTVPPSRTGDTWRTSRGRTQKISSQGVSDDVHKKIAADNIIVNQVSFPHSGGWVIISDTRMVATDMPPSAVEVLRELYQKNDPAKRIAFAPDGGWVILRGKNGYWTRDVSQELNDILGELRDERRPIDDVAFSPKGGWVVISRDRLYWTTDLPADLIEEFEELSRDGKEITSVAFTPRGGWLVIFGRNGFSHSNLPAGVAEKLKEVNSRGDRIQGVTFTPGGGWVVLSSKD